ncbi:unnamed protein product [Ectocarpus sp. 12 AP-2014]
MWAKHSSPVMIRRAKRAAIFASPFVAVGLWAGYVLKERRKAPAEVRFSIGSADDVLTEQLKTGDVLLFSRRWTQMLPAGAALSVMKRSVFDSRFDHAGVVVADRFGTPHVAEVTYTGIKLRRFDERILRSKCNEIMLIPVNFKCSEETRAKVERHVKGLTYREPIANTLWIDLLGVLKLKTTKPGEWDKPPKYVTEPPIIGKIVPASPAVQLVMSCLDIAGAADGAAVAEWKYPLAITPKDLENCEVPLKEGANFGELHTVRVRQ